MRVASILLAWKSSVVVAAVDPGCPLALSARRFLPNACCDPASIPDISMVWDSRGAACLKESGRTLPDERERHIFREMGVDVSYGVADNTLCGITTKTCCSNTFLQSCCVVSRTVFGLVSERHKVSQSKSRLRFASSAKAMDRIASTIFGSKAEHLDLRMVVLYGDGISRSMRQPAAAPKKTLVKVLASRAAAFVVDDYRISKTYPGGFGGDLVDVAGMRPVRR